MAAETTTVLPDRGSMKKDATFSEFISADLEARQEWRRKKRAKRSSASKMLNISIPVIGTAEEIEECERRDHERRLGDNTPDSSLNSGITMSLSRLSEIAVERADWLDSRVGLCDESIWIGEIEVFCELKAGHAGPHQSRRDLEKDATIEWGNG